MPSRTRNPRHPKTAAPMPVFQPDAAGIDIGATEVYVAVPAERDPQPIRAFGTFTEDLLSLVAWLKTCHIRTVAIEPGAPRAAGCTGSRCSSYWRRTVSKSVW